MFCINLRKTDSTSAFLKRHRRIIPDMTFVSAAYQTAGRGRIGRSWESLPGDNLLFSFICKKSAVTDSFAYLSCAAALCVAQILQEYGLDDVKIKWPNDVYCHGRKICGILLEGITSGSELSGVVTGVGLNVNQTEFSGDNLRAPTSMMLECGNKFSVSDIRRRLYPRLATAVAAIEHGDFSFVKEIQNMDYLKGMSVRAEFDGSIKDVEVLGIGDDCTLCVRCEGKELHLNSGEITFHI